MRRITSAFAKFSDLAPKDQRDLICIFLALVVVAVYLPVTGCGFVGYDDPAYTYQNPNVKYGLNSEALWWGLTTLHGDIAYWHPLTWFSHQLDFQLFKANAAAHHLTSVLLHAANCVWVFLIATRLTGRMTAGLVVAFLFGVHPLRVESVAWLSERKDVLCAFFYFASICFYFRYADRPSFKRYLTVLACFLGALASKPMAVTLPCVLVLLDVWPLRRVSLAGVLSFLRPASGRPPPQHRVGSSSRDDPLIHSLALADGGEGGRRAGEGRPAPAIETTNSSAGLSSPLLRRLWDVRHRVVNSLSPRRRSGERVRVRGNPINTAVLVFSEKLPFFALALAISLLAVKAQQDLKAVVPPEMLPLQERLANAVVSYAAYIHKTFLPVRLTVHYSHPFVQPLWLVAVSAGFLALLTGVIIRIRRAHPLCLVGWLWFLGALVPTIGLIQVGSQSMADRYTYIPSVGFFLVLVSFGDLLPSLSRRAVLLVRSATAFGVVALTVFTVKQLGHWTDSRSLFDHAVKVDPRDFIAQNNLGKAYQNLNQPELAIKHYQAAIEASPDAGFPKLNLGDVHLGRGKPALALVFYYLALASDENTRHLAHGGLAEAYLQLRNTAAAVCHYREAIKAKPSLLIAKIRLAEILATTTDPRIRDSREAVRLALEACNKTHHRDPLFLSTLAAAYAENGQFAQAIETAERAMLQARKAKASGLQNHIKERLTLYRQGRARPQPARTALTEKTDAD